jgi:hypothetical protein
MIKGRKEEALFNLARLHARGDTSDVFVQAEYAELDAKVSAEAQIRSGWVEVSMRSQRCRETL